MDRLAAQHVALALIAIALGVAGWLLPYRWNPLRLRRGVASFVSEKVNLLIPKIVGTLLVVVGLVVLIAAVAGLPLR